MIKDTDTINKWKIESEYSLPAANEVILLVIEKLRRSRIEENIKERVT